MPKTNRKQSKTSWLFIAIITIFASLPAAILIKLLTEEINPHLVPVLRYGVVTLVALPFVVSALRKHRKAILKKLPIIISCSTLLAVGVPMYYVALSMSNVLFTEIIGLFCPILFAIFSVMVVRDRMPRNAIIGLLFAAMGGMVIIAFPVWFGEGAIVEFGWLPLVLMAINIVVTAFAPVYYRKMDEDGIPIMATLGITFTFVFVASIIMAIVDSGPEVFYEIKNLSINSWVVLVYLGAIVTLILRHVKVKAYEQIGTASQASVDYLAIFLGLAAPIIVLGETISLEMIIGAVFIIIGIVLTRKHTSHKKLFTTKPKPHRKRRK